MPISPEKIKAIAGACTAAWNSASPQAVASFHAADGGIVINRGMPWVGRTGVAQMVAGA